MKHTLFLATSLGLIVLAAPAWALGPKATIFAKYDANKNGIIDGDEVAAVRQAFAADPKGQFASYDKDHDGKLSDAEIAAIKPPGAKGAGGKAKDPAAKKKSGAEKQPEGK